MTCPEGPTAWASARVVSPWPQPISRTRDPGGMSQEETRARRWVNWETRFGEGSLGEAPVWRKREARCAAVGEGDAEAMMTVEWWKDRSNGQLRSGKQNKRLV